MRKNAALWPAVASERGIVNLRRNLLFEERVFSSALRRWRSRNPRILTLADVPLSLIHRSSLRQAA